MGTKQLLKNYPHHSMLPQINVKKTPEVARMFESCIISLSQLAIFEKHCDASVLLFITEQIFAFEVNRHTVHKGPTQSSQLHEYIVVLSRLQQ